MKRSHPRSLNAGEKLRSSRKSIGNGRDQDPTLASGHLPPVSVLRGPALPQHLVLLCTTVNEFLISMDGNMADGR